MKYIVTVIISFLSLTAFAQKDTTTVCMPLEVAKQITQDLVIGDSAQAMLNVAVEELQITKDKMNYKDSLILNAKLKELNLMDQIKNERQQKEGYNTLYLDAKKQYGDLSKQFKRYKAKKTFMDILGGVIIGGLAYLYITK